MQKKKYIVCVIIMFMSLMLCSCEVKEDVSEDKQKNSDFIFQFKEMSDVSMMSVNQMVKYTSEYTDAKLYKWSEDIVLPFPMPETEGAKAYIGDYVVEVLGIDEVAWKKYCKMIFKEYYVISTEVDIDKIDVEYGAKYSENKEVTYFQIVDMNQNYVATIRWYDILEDSITSKKYQNIMHVDVQFGNQESNSEFTNEEILKMVIDKLEVSEEKREGFYICDITSHSNINDGFGVYYVVMPHNTGLEYELDNGLVKQPNNALCVVKDEKIVFFKYDYLVYGGDAIYNNEVEFLNVDGVWEMYVLRYFNNGIGSGDIGGQMIDRYRLNDDYFEFVKQYDLCNDIKIIEADQQPQPGVTFEKEEDCISIYKVIQHNTSIVHKKCRLGEKVGTLEFK